MVYGADDCSDFEEMIMAELKACPFCGESPVTEVRVSQMGGGTDIVDFSVVCCNCGTEKTVRLRIHMKCDFDFVNNAMADVIGVWNRRIGDNENGH